MKPEDIKVGMRIRYTKEFLQKYIDRGHHSLDLLRGKTLTVTKKEKGRWINWEQIKIGEDSFDGDDITIEGYWISHSYWEVPVFELVGEESSIAVSSSLCSCDGVKEQRSAGGNWYSFCLGCRKESIVV